MGLRQRYGVAIAPFFLQADSLSTSAPGPVVCCFSLARVKPYLGWDDKGLGSTPRLVAFSSTTESPYSGPTPIYGGHYDRSIPSSNMYVIGVVRKGIIVYVSSHLRPWVSVPHHL